MGLTSPPRTLEAGAASAPPDARVPQHLGELLVSPSAFADGRVHRAYRWLRKNLPFGQAHVTGFDPFWVATRHQDILEISRQNDLFHNGDRSTGLIPKIVDEQVRALTGGSPHLMRTLIDMDAPDHPKYRHITQGWFMPANLRKLEDSVRQLARGAVGRMAAAGGQCDFVTEVALHYPLHVIMNILGVPVEDEGLMLKLTQEIFGAGDRELSGKSAGALAQGGLQRLDTGAAVDEFFEYFRALSTRRRADPRDDVVSVIANSTIDGVPISDLEALSYYVAIATAGHDTSSACVSGGLWALAENPLQFAKLKADLSLIPGFVDESLRWTTPVKTFMRTATEDVSFAGQPVRAGDWVMLCYTSGNRDEAVFEDPDEFRIDRSPNRHLSFGYGAHLCLGQHLAKLEMRVLWEELIPRLASIELAGRPEVSEAVFVNRARRLPVRYQLV